MRVQVDVSFTFHIGSLDDPEQLERDAVNFVYHLGPQRLEEMLEAETEEEIRSFVYKYKSTRIRDLKSELTDTMKDSLNRKFNDFGVYFENVVITQVIIPAALEYPLLTTTTYDAYL